MPEHYFEHSSGHSTPPFAGLEFIELATRQPDAVAEFLQAMGFVACAHHRSKAVTLFRQGAINLLINATVGSFASDYADALGTSVCALALRTPNASSAYQSLLARGAWEASTSAGAMELNIPAVESIGGTQIYLIDRYADGISIYDIDFKAVADAPADAGLLSRVDGIGLAMSAPRQGPWADFFTQLFGFSRTDDNRLLLAGELALELEIDGRRAPVDELIASVRFQVTDMTQVQRQLSANGLTLRPLATPSGDGYIVEPPFEHCAVRFIIAP